MCRAAGSDGWLEAIPGFFTQTQSADNSIEQTAIAKSAALNLAPNVALLNQGDTTQSSNSSAASNAGNASWADQSNIQNQIGGLLS